MINNIIIYASITLITMLIIFAIAKFIFHSKFKTKETTGKKLVIEILKQIPDSIVINDAIVSENKVSMKIDHILITKLGIFAFITREQGGLIQGDRENSKWSQTLYEKRSYFPNPLIQNLDYVDFIKRSLKKEGLNTEVIPIYSIAIFSNKNISFSFDYPDVVKVTELYETMLSFEPNEILSVGKMEILEKILNKHNSIKDNEIKDNDYAPTVNRMRRKKRGLFRK